VTQGEGRFVGGDPAGEAVAGDPFWSVVRRRHRDVDIALLPPAAADEVALPAGGETVDPDAEAERLDREATRLWEQLGQAGEPVRSARWTSGQAPGTVRRETTLVLDGVDPILTTGRVTGAAGTLADAGWHVLAPPDGMPRVLAGRDADIGRVELSLVHAAAHDRLVLRVRSGSVLVEDPRALVGEDR
jgi:hypothetical protein